MSKQNNLLGGFGFLVIAIIWLFLSFNFNFWVKAGEPGQFENFQNDSEGLVISAVQNTLESGLLSNGGFLLHLGKPYLSQSGLQGLIIATLAPNDASFLPIYFIIVRAVLALLMSIVMAVYLQVISREFGLITALILLILVSFSDWLIFFARNMYWVIFISFLPFVITWYIYPLLRTPSQKKGFYTFLFFSVFVKSLCGYEYVTNVVLSVCIPIIYYELKQFSSLSSTLKKCVVPIIFSGLGFSAALLVHLVQCAMFLGSFAKGVHAILARTMARTAWDSDPYISIVYSYDLSNIITKFGLNGWNDTFNGGIENVLRYLINIYTMLGDPFKCGIEIFLRYLVKHVLTLPFGMAIPLFVIILMIGLIKHIIKKANKKHNNANPHTAEISQKIYALYTAVVVSFFISSTWFLAWGHMRHFHINSIIFYLPFLLTAYVLISHILSKAIINQLQKYS